MREIKFRVWDKAQNLYLQSDEAYITINPYAPVKGDENEIIEQFTGFYDSEGKEVYEGDIIEYKHTMTPQRQTTTVKWNERWGYIYPFYHITCNGIKEAEIKIIGNTHENKAVSNGKD